MLQIDGYSGYNSSCKDGVENALDVVGTRAEDSSFVAQRAALGRIAVRGDAGSGADFTFGAYRVKSAAWGWS